MCAYFDVCFHVCARVSVFADGYANVLRCVFLHSKVSHWQILKQDLRNCCRYTDSEVDSSTLKKIISKQKMPDLHILSSFNLGKRNTNCSGILLSHMKIAPKMIFHILKAAFY